MLQVYFSNKFKFWPCKLCFSPDPVILDLKLQLARILNFLEREPRLHDEFFPKISVFNSRKSLWDMDQNKLNFSFKAFSAI